MFIEADLLLEIAAHSCSPFDVFLKLLDLALAVLDDGVVHVVGLLVVVCDVHDVSLLALLLWSWLRFRWLFFGNCWIVFLLLDVGGWSVAGDLESSFDDLSS